MCACVHGAQKIDRNCTVNLYVNVRSTCNYCLLKIVVYSILDSGVPIFQLCDPIFDAIF